MRPFGLRFAFTGLLSALAVGVIAGCGSGASAISGTVPVKGKVMYKGQPVADASITFVGQGSEARSASGRSGSDGSYSLRTLETEGAIPGTYTVLVTKTEAAAVSSGAATSMEDAAKATAAPEAKQLLPAKYATAESPLKIEVKAGSGPVDLTLED